MKRTKILLAALVIFACAGSAHAWRRDGEKTKPVYVDNGDRTDRFAVLAGTTTPVVLFSTNTYASGVRKVTICNAEAFRLYVGTFSAVSGSTVAAVNARLGVPTNSCHDTTPELPLWGIYESASGGTSKVVTGAVHYQFGD